MDKLMKILNDIRPDIDFAKEDRLLSAGILTSIDLIALIDAIESAYDVELKSSLLTPQNFNSAEGILKLIEKLAE